MDEPKAATATTSVIRSLLWSGAVVLAIIGTIEILAYGEDGISYYIGSAVFAVAWGAYSLITRKSNRRS